MGRPEPCVLYAHTFVHPHLDEYVDEVLFSEPVVITACEFLEQNAPSLCPAVKLMGATSPPSFALEVFVHCEGETRFRRLCLPFLYSHSSSNVLEVEAVVTNHLVVRGSYRSLSMVIYGNTAEDLGQFNIEVDLDSSLTETVSAVEGNLEDLPPAFRPTNFLVEELISPLKILSHLAVPSDVPLELRQFLQLVFKILDCHDQASADEVLSPLLSVASTYATHSSSYKTFGPRHHGNDKLMNDGDATEGKKLADIYARLQNQSVNPSPESSAESIFLESETGVPTSKDLVDTLHQRFDLCSSAGNVGYPHLSQNKNTILWLSLASLLCSARESCFHFVNYGGLKQLQYAFTHQNSGSTALKLLLLRVVEQATRHSVGCEGFLGWWPREDESIPSGLSDGYNQLLKLLLENHRHDVASLATYILHRIRFYEAACRYEGAVLSILGGATSGFGGVSHLTLDMLTSAKVQLKKLLKMIKLSGPIDDPSPVAAASRSILLGDAGPLSYQATRGLINLSNCSFSNWDIDSHLLSLLKERGFLPLSAALLSSSICRSEKGHALDLLVDVASHIEAIILSLLFSRSGLDFLLHDPEVSSTVIRALRGIEDVQMEDPISLRYASVLISKGFFCHPREVGMIIQMHTKALIAVDGLIKLTPNTEEFLWVLWDLCRLSRTECGRQALLVLLNFPQALEVLIAALHSGREFDPVSLNPGISPLNLAIYHSVAEILEVIVTDSTATSLMSWIDHAKELHTALYSSSPGSNKKDAPARLLEWIDGGVVYHKNGAIGLLRYAAVLASGGDAHMASNSVLASDMMDVDNVVGDFSSTSDGSVIDNLIGKRITEKDFPGVVLRDSSIAQLTTAFRILAFISDNSVVAAALYDEGAVMVIHAVLINCKLMFERSSNIYDYLVDEGAERNSTSDLLIERNREKNLVDLLIPSLVLLINLLQKLQEAKEQHRNTKLMNAILLLHREVSPKLAACASELTHSCPDSALGFGAVCHLLASALACWPLYSWTPGLFHFLLESLRANSLLAMGPKETCSLFCLLNDLLPDESICLWKNEMPLLSNLRTLAVGTLLGPEREKRINWYLRPGYPEKLVAQLSPQISKVGEIILHCAISMSVVIQDILRVFIIRIACLNVDNASVLLKSIISWISDRISGSLIISEVDIYKVHQLLNFLGILVEHPNAKPLLLKEGGFQMFTKVLERCIGATGSDAKQLPENFNVAKRESTLCSWLIPVFKSITLICDSQASVKHPGEHDKNIPDNFTAEECSIIWSYLLRFCVVLPVGRELVACLSAVKEMGSYTQGQNALLSIITRIQPSTVESCEPQIQHESDARWNIANASEWKEHPPLLQCWTNLLKSIELKDVPAGQVATAMNTLSSGALSFCMDGKSLNLERVAVIKFLFGIKNENCLEALIEESQKHMEELTVLLGSEASSRAASDSLPRLYQVKETANLLLLLLQKSFTEEDATIASGYMSLFAPTVSLRIHKIADSSMKHIEDHHLDEFEAKFFWECPENLRDRLTQTGVPGKRKISSVEGPNRHARGDNLVAEATAQSTFSRGSAPVTTPSGPTRRDTFRQRKPNTSRPPSMHVDDYVARERNADGTNSSNVIAVPRIGSTSGRPPSIHVDEFMARQKDRQNVVGVAVSDAAAQVKTRVTENKMDEEKSSKPQQLKPDLDDDLGIDIVFDAEESEPDDKLPFPQPDDILQQPPPVVAEQHSPHSVVEETESDANESSQFSRLGTPLTSKTDENTMSEFSTRMSASHPDMPLTREPSISSDKKFSDQSDDKSFPIRTSNMIDSSAIVSSSGSASVYVNAPPSSGQFPIDSSSVPKLYSQPNPQPSGTVPLGGGLQGPYGQKFPSNHPPLPPMPPPPTISPVISQNMDYFGGQSSPFVKSAADVQAQVKSEYGPMTGSNPTSLATSMGLPDMKFGRAPLSSPGGTTRPPPPLPPTPPPFSAASSLNNPTSQSSQYFQPVSNSEPQQTSIAHSIDGGQVNLSASRPTLPSYPLPPLMQPMLFRPGSVPVNPYGNSMVAHNGDNLTGVSQNFPVSLPPTHSMPTLTQLQPLQPPHIPRPPPQHFRPSVPVSPQAEPGSSLLQGSLQIPAQASHVLQQRQVSPAHVYYQSQQENVPHSSQQQQPIDRSQRSLQIPGDGTSLQQDSGMSLQEFFRSPEAIQSLLSDRDKLCQLLEQHPKLMQMLQERLGQL